MVRFENVGLRYGLGPEVLRDVSFHLKTGSFHFLTGPSGAGKTSLLRLMLLSLKPSRGSAQIFGKDIAALSRNEMPPMRRRIGVVFQDFRLLDHLTTFENVALPLRVQKAKSSQYRDDVMELIELTYSLACIYAPVFIGLLRKWKIFTMFYQQLASLHRLHHGRDLIVISLACRCRPQ